MMKKSFISTSLFCLSVTISSHAATQSQDLGKQLSDQPSLIRELFANLSRYTEQRQLFSLWIADLLLPADQSNSRFDGFEVAAGAGALNVLSNIAQVEVETERSQLASSLHNRIANALALNAIANAMELRPTSQSIILEDPDATEWYQFSTDPQQEYVLSTETCSNFYAVALLDDLQTSIGGGYYQNGRHTLSTEAPEIVYLRIRAPSCSNKLITLTSRTRPVPLELSEAQEQAPTVQAEGIYSSRLPNGASRWATFSAAQGNRYRFEVIPLEGFDSVLYLYDADGQSLLRSNDDGGIGGGSLIKFQATEDTTLYIEVAEYSNSQGNFELAITQIPPLAELARGLTVGEQITSSIADNREENLSWWRFEAVAGSTYEIKAEALDQADTRIKLYASDGQSLLAEDDDGGPGLSSELVFTPSDSATYYLATEDISGFDAAYSVTVSVFDVESNDPDDLIPNSPVITRFTADTLERWWRFQTQSNTDYVIETTSTSNVDTVMSLYRESSMEFVDFDDDGGEDLGSRISFSGNGDSFLIQVESYDGETGDFSLSVMPANQ